MAILQSKARQTMEASFSFDCIQVRHNERTRCAPVLEHQRVLSPEKTELCLSEKGLGQ
jgi:hypothetical protein